MHNHTPEAPSSGRASIGEQLLSRPLSARSLGLILLAWVAAGLLLAGLENLARLAAASPPAPPSFRPVVSYLLHAPLWTLATVAVILLTRWFPLRRGAVLRNGAALTVAGILVTSGRVALFYLLIQALGLLSAGRPDADFIYAAIHYGAEDIFIYWAMVLAIHAVRHSHAVQEREVARAQLETQLTQAQLQALKVQIQPHFLFNTLHAIATLVREDPARAERMVEHLSEMLRTTLTHGRAQEVTVREELATLRPYLEIEKVRLGERLELQMEIDPEVQGAAVPHLLLQPLVENAIRHGISPRRRPGWVRVEVRGGEGCLHLIVADNGRGMSGPVRPGAIGLENTRARLRQLYGEQHQFEIETAQEEGTRIAIAIPLRAAPDPASPLAPV